MTSRQTPLLERLNAYESSHLLEHLAISGRAADVHKLLGLEDRDALNAWHVSRTRYGTDVDFQRDIEFAARLVDDHYAELPLVLKCRYGLISSSISAIHNRFPTRFISKLVSVGAWSLRQALDTIETFEEGTRRAFALEELFSQISADYFDRVAELAINLPNTCKEITTEPNGSPDVIVYSPKAEILAGLSQWKNDWGGRSIASQAIEAAIAIRDLSDRARSFGRILPNLPNALKNEVAKQIITIAKNESNPERAFLLIPVVKYCADEMPEIWEDIPGVASLDRSYRNEQSKRYLKDLFQEFARSGGKLSKAALDFTVNRVGSKAASGLSASLCAGGIEIHAVRDSIARHRPARMNKSQEAEWLHFMAHVCDENSAYVATQLQYLRHVENRVAFFAKVNERIEQHERREMAYALACDLSKIRSAEERCKTSSLLIRTRCLDDALTQEVAERAVKDSAKIRNAPPRLSVLLGLIDSVPELESAVSLFVKSVGALRNKRDQVEAWLDLEARTDRSTAIRSHDPWSQAYRIFGSISPQKSKMEILVRLTQLRPKSLFSVLKADLFSLDTERRVMTIVKVMSSFDAEQKNEAVSILTDLIFRSRDPKVQQMVLSRGSEFFELHDCKKFLEFFRSLSDNKAQQNCLGKIAGFAPRILAEQHVASILKQNATSRSVVTSVEPIANELDPNAASLLYNEARSVSQPIDIARLFNLLGDLLPRSDHSSAIKSAISVKNKNIRTEAVSIVLEKLRPAVLDEYENAIARLVPSPSRFQIDRSLDKLVVAVCKNYAKQGRFEKTFLFLARIRDQGEAIIALSKYLALDSEILDDLILSIGDVFNLEARANIYLALLVWRAEHGFRDHAFEHVCKLDGYCQPIVLTCLAQWLEKRQISMLLENHDLILKRPEIPPAKEQIWDFDDQKGFGSYSMVSAGYFAPTPKEPASTAKIVSSLLVRLVVLGEEDRAWSLVHYMNDADMVGFIVSAAPNISDSGLQKMEGFARSFENQENYIIAIGAVAIEAAKRGVVSKSEQLIHLLPVRSSQTLDFHRYQRVGQLTRSMMTLGLAARSILPADISGLILDPHFDTYPRLAVAIGCLLSSPNSESDDFIALVFRELDAVNLGAVEENVIRSILSTSDLPSRASLEMITNKFLGAGGQNTTVRRRQRDKELVIVGELASAINAVHGEAGIVALYKDVQNVCRWFA